MEYVHQEKINNLSKELKDLRVKREEFMKKFEVESEHSFQKLEFKKIEDLQLLSDIEYAIRTIHEKVGELMKDKIYSDEEKEDMKHIKNSIKEYSNEIEKFK